MLAFHKLRTSRSTSESTSAKGHDQGYDHIPTGFVFHGAPLLLWHSIMPSKLQGRIPSIAGSRPSREEEQVSSHPTLTFLTSLHKNRKSQCKDRLGFELQPFLFKFKMCCIGGVRGNLCSKEQRAQIRKRP
jgi:hypothetical protein